MLLSGALAAAGAGVLLLAVATKVFNLRAFGQINNLLAFAVALLLLAIFVLLWEITLRLIARSDD